MIMPVTQGTLTQQQKVKIRKNHTYLLEQMDLTLFLDYCVNEKLLTIPEVMELDDDKLIRKDRNRRFIALLKCSGDNAFSKFLKLLKEHGGEEIAKRVEETEVDTIAVQESGAAGGSLELSDKQKQCRLTTKDLLAFAAAVSVTDIHRIGLALGLETNEIETIIIDYHVHGVKTQRLYMFNKWLAKQGKAGTIQNIVERLEEAEDYDIKVDWVQVKKAVDKVKSAC